jgi:hypothetical protein
MWWPGELKQNAKRFIFGDGTTTYEIDKQSDLGRRVGQGEAGIAVHGYYSTTEDKDPIPLKNTAGLNVNGRLCILGPEIKVEGNLQLSTVRIKDTISYVKKNAKTIDSFLDQSILREMKMSGLPDMLYTFVNQQTRTRDLSDLASKFMPWVQSNPKLSKVMVQKVIDYCTTNKDGLIAIFNVFDAVTALKLDIIHQLDSHNGPVYAHVNGERGGEGYVISDPAGYIKSVDRAHFSAANFANH